MEEKENYDSTTLATGNAAITNTYQHVYRAKESHEVKGHQKVFHLTSFHHDALTTSSISHCRSQRPDRLLLSLVHLPV